MLFAHRLLAPKADLPIPEEAFAWISASVLVISFVVLSASWLEPVFEDRKWTPRDLLSRIVVNPVTEFLAGALGVFLLGVVVWSGLYGTGNSAANFNVTFVFVTFWVCTAIASMIEVKDGRLGTRPWFSGAVGWGLVPGSIAFVLVAIAGTTFDGASEGVLADWIDSVYEFINGGADAEGDVLARRATASLFMLLTFSLVFGVFWAGIKRMGTEGSKLSVRQLARTFAHCFIPIAFAYTLAHYFSLVVFQEQAQFTYLLSDPLGDGSDYFGTASGTVDLRTVSSEQVWYVQVGALVAGHIAALAMGHDKALAVYKNLRRATQSQYWMLALMVTFTVVGLLLLSAANE